MPVTQILTQVFQLIATNNLELIQQHFPSVTNIKITSNYLLVPLQLHIQQRQVELEYLKYLTWDEAGGTILHIRNISLPVIRYILKHLNTIWNTNVDTITSFLNTPNTNGDTLLHIASKNTDIELLKLLLNYDADPYLQNSQGYTVLHAVISANDDNNDDNENYPASYSKSNAILCIFTLMEAEKRFKSKSNWKPLLSIENKYHETCLAMARNRNDDNLIKALHSCLQKSIVQNHLLELVLSVKRKAFPEEKKEKTIKDLAPFVGCSIMDEQDSNGMTILHLAAEGGLANILKYIFRYISVNLACRDKKGRTALHYAALNGHSENGQSCLDILLENDRYMLNSIKNFTDNNGKTALEIALELQAIKACQIMLKYGCDIYSKDLLLRIYKTMPQIVETYFNYYGAFILTESNGVLGYAEQADFVNNPTNGGGPVLYYSFSAIIGQDSCDQSGITSPQTTSSANEKTSLARNRRPSYSFSYQSSELKEYKHLTKNPSTAILVKDVEFVHPIPRLQPKNQNLRTNKSKSPPVPSLKEETRYLIHVLNASLENRSKILNHPLVKLFLHQKWAKFRTWYYGYLIFYFLFLIMYSWYTVFVFAVECPYTKAMSMGVPTAYNHTNTNTLSRVRRDYYPKNSDYPYHGQPPKNGPILLPCCPPNPIPSGFTTEKPVTRFSVYPHKKPDLTFNRNGVPKPTLQPKSTPAYLPDAGHRFPETTWRPSRIVGIILIIPATIILLKTWISMQENEIFHERLIHACQIVAMVIIIFNCAQSCIAYTGMESWRYILAWFGIFSAWVASMDEVGKIPLAGKYVSVWKAVTLRSLGFLLPFIPLMAAFSFAFKVMLPENARFSTISSSGLTLMAFMIGEIEYSDLLTEMDLTSPFPTPAVQIFFGIFIFVIPLVLLNLLIGLAVNVSQVINDGSIDFCCKQLKDIYFTEKALIWFATKFGQSQNNWIQKYFVRRTKKPSSNNNKTTNFTIATAAPIRREGITNDIYICEQIPKNFQYEIQAKCSNLHWKPASLGNTLAAAYHLYACPRLHESREQSRCWVSTNTAEPIPKGCLVAGVDHGIIMHIIRACYAGGIIPGKHTGYPTNSYAWILYAGIEVKVHEFEILKISPDLITWTKINVNPYPDDADNDGSEERDLDSFTVSAEPLTTTTIAPTQELPGNALIGGISADGTDLLIGRTPHEGTVTVGKVDKRTKILYISYYGEEYIYTEYELLCYKKL